MKLVLATPLYPPEPGGPATYAKILEEGLPSRGIEVEVIKFGDVRHLPKLVRHAAFFWFILKTGRHADLIFAQDTISCGIPAVLAATLLRKPIIIRVPGDYAWEQAQQRWYVSSEFETFQTAVDLPWQVHVLRKLQSWVVKSADRVLVPSHYFANVVAGWGVKKAAISVIYHGITLPFETQPAEMPAEKKLIVSIGRLVPWKGFDFLLTLLPRLPSWHLAIIGDGPDKSRLEMMARHAGVAERVSFVGGLPRTEALGWIVRAEAFVLATKWESFSFQIIEAMALGAAVITTRVGSIPELLVDGVEGRLLDPQDTEGFVRAIASIDEDPGVWGSRKKAAQQKAEFFSEERMLDRTAQLLMDL